MAHSAEEEVARDFLCFGGADGAVVVCDATCLERNLNLVLQTLEITPRTVVCVNLMDEARSKGIEVDTAELSRLLGVPVVAAAAGRNEGLGQLMEAVADMAAAEEAPHAFRPGYPSAVERALARLEPVLARRLEGRLPARWTALRLLDQDPSLLCALEKFLEIDLMEDPEVRVALLEAQAGLKEEGLDQESLRETVVASLVRAGAEIAGETVTFHREDCLLYTSDAADEL